MKITGATLGFAVATLGSSLGGGAALAQDGDDADLGPLVQVSDASPFGALENCGNFPGVLDPAGEVFLGSEVEPWVDVNPQDPANVVGFWQQDRWSNGGARSNVAGASFDGGESWEIVVVPGLSDCSGGFFERASDPWVSFSPDGTLHQISLVFDNDIPEGFGPNALAVSKSEDGGLSWSEPILIIEDFDPAFLNDKESLTADPTDADLVYAVWDRLGVFGFDFEGPTYFARSTDGGETWERARRIFDPGLNNQTIGNQIVVLPDGTLLDFFNEIINFRPSGAFEPFPFNLSFIRSRNEGVNWLPRRRGIRIDKLLAIGVATPDEGLLIRDASILFDVAVDRNSGHLYAVWQDARFSRFEYDQIAFSMSTDGGSSWSEAIKVNQTPLDPANPLRQQAFIPSVAVAGDGAVGVTYYDFRNDDDAGEFTDHWLVRCQSDCASAESWSGEQRLTAASFDYRDAPEARGLFLGDYVGLAADESAFLAFFAQAFPDDPASGFFRRSDEAEVAAEAARTQMALGR
jgi:hypothetical protein